MHEIECTASQLYAQSIDSRKKKKRKNTGIYSFFSFLFFSFLYLHVYPEVGTAVLVGRHEKLDTGDRLR